MMIETLHWNEDTLNAALEAPGIVLVDFWANWCMPCKMLAPSIEKLAAQYEGRVAVGKIDVDEEPDLAARYNIQSIPAVLLFRDGQLRDTFIGARPFDTFTKALDALLD